MTRKRAPTAPPPAPGQAESLERAVAATTPADGPGAKAFWRSPDDGAKHPVTVLFRCCQASVGGGFVCVVDEFGWTHLATDAELQPRADGPDYQSRPAGPRKAP